MAERLKSLTNIELKNKYVALLNYIRDVENEMELREIQRNESTNNTFPLFDINNLFKSEETLEKKTDKTIKKTKPKNKEVDNDNQKKKSEIPIKSTVKIIKLVLDDHNIKYKSNITKDGLIKLVRENYLVKKCNAETEKIKNRKNIMNK